MKLLRIGVVVGLLGLAAPLAGSAQQAIPSEEPAAVAPRGIPGAGMPRLIKFSGVLKDALGQPFGSGQDKPRTGVVGLTFALYADQEGGAPLWLETQNVTLDPDGRYTVLLGATQREGLPLKLFATSEARWLGIQAAGEPEQPRILLVSVPYALKAEEAERLAGKTATDFVLAEELKTPEGREKLGLLGTEIGPPDITAARFRATANPGPGFISLATSGPPLTVGSAGRVANLNADLLDSLDSADLQRRVTGTCAVGSSIRVINADGTVACEPDDTGGTASDLDCVGCVSEPELGFAAATQAELDAHKASDDHAAAYVNVAGDTMSGALSLTAAGTGLSVSNDASLGGNLNLPNTASASVGVLTMGGFRFLHNFGIDNTFVGAGAGNFAMTGGSNTGVGASALASNTTGFFNSAFGQNALTSNTEGEDNSAFGQSALASNTTGNSNSTFGRRALFSNTTGGENSAFGTSALFSNTEGNNNSAFGTDALGSNTTGGENSAFGQNALTSNTEGVENSALGSQALFSNTTGGRNSAFGREALRGNTEGSQNSAFGSQALQNNTTGSENSAFGEFALFSNTVGNFNSAFGRFALVSLTSGDENTAIGRFAGLNLTSGSGNLYIASPGASSESGIIRIGTDGTHTATFLAGTVTAPAFVGDGAGLTNVTAGTATDLNCAACVAVGELTFDPSTQTELDAHKASDDHAAAYVNVAGDTMNGALSLTAAGTGLSVTNDATVGGSLTLGGSINGGLRIQADPTSPNLIGGSPANFFSGGVVGAAVSGGGDLGNPNRVTDNFGTVGGGGNNRAGDNAGTTSDRPYATVGGGQSNTASGDGATVGGGAGNTASGVSSTVGRAGSSTVGGGTNNTASGELATVGGGLSNTASDFAATVGGGQGNNASGAAATVGGGQSNTASGTQATVPGGVLNTAQGVTSFAAGQSARALHSGAFVWGDSSGISFIDSTADNQFTARAAGGVRFFSNSTLTAGVTLAPGASAWLVVSDRASKENFQEVDGKELLARLDAIPVLTWNWIAQGAGVRHMGPIAQDFRAAFGVGEDDKHISTVDADGVALAAVQALYRLVQEKDDQLRQLAQEVKELRAQMASLSAKLEAK